MKERKCGCVGDCSHHSPLYPEDPIKTTEQLTTYEQQLKELNLTNLSTDVNAMGRREFLKKGFTLLAGMGLLGLLPGCLNTDLDRIATPSVKKSSNLEKPDLTIGFLPIICSSPILLADALGLYRKYGLNVTIKKFGGFAEVRDSLITNQLDVAHILSPMAIALSMGLGSTKVPVRIAAMENLNGSAITLSIEHKDRVKQIKDLKGMKLGIPFEYSMHNLLLRHYLQTGGLDPNRDVELRLTRPPDMVANLVSKNLDGYIVAEPFNQRAVKEGYGFIYKLSKDLWTDHPCCALGIKQEFVDRYPKTYQALLKAIVEAIYYCSSSEKRNQLAKLIAPKQYLNQKPAVLKTILTGKFPNGLGQKLNEPDRIDFDPFPWKSAMAWTIAEMAKWGYIKQTDQLNIQKVVDEVCLTDGVRRVQQELGQTAPVSDYRVERIMGKTYDLKNSQEWLSK